MFSVLSTFFVGWEPLMVDTARNGWTHNQVQCHKLVGARIAKLTEALQELRWAQDRGLDGHEYWTPDANAEFREAAADMENVRSGFRWAMSKPQITDSVIRILARGRPATWQTRAVYSNVFSKQKHLHDVTDTEAEVNMGADARLENSPSAPSDSVWSCMHIHLAVFSLSQQGFCL